MRLMHASVLVCLICLASVAVAEQQICRDNRVTVMAESKEHVALTCSIVSFGVDVLKQCNAPVIRPLKIELVAELSPGCLGLYHCGLDRIEVLRPSAMAKSRSEKSSLAHVSDLDFFRSIIVHELAHAAFDGVPCPFDHCIATAEYVAHNMQIMSLPQSDIARFESRLDMNARVSRDELNVMLYLMAPDKFLRKSWIHLNQRPDACRYIGDIMAGKVRMDRVHP